MEETAFGGDCVIGKFLTKHPPSPSYSIYSDREGMKELVSHIPAPLMQLNQIAKMLQAISAGRFDGQPFEWHLALLP